MCHQNSFGNYTECILCPENSEGVVYNLVDVIKGILCLQRLIEKEINKRAARNHWRHKSLPMHTVSSK